MNVPNIITIARIILIPFFVGILLHYREAVNAGLPSEWARQSAIILFALCIASDSIDGLIARSMKKKSTLGTILDPLADKMLLMTSAVLLSLPIGLRFKLPSWYPVAIIGRDVILIAGALLLYMLKGSLKVAPSLIGKTASVAQMITIMYLLLNLPSPQTVWFIAVGLTIISGVHYIWVGTKQFNGNSVSSDQP